jgi:hypothetical protein
MKKTSKKIGVIIVCFGFITNSLYAQNSYLIENSRIFEHLDKSKITTNLLSEYGAYFVELEIFNGTPSDSNFVDINTFRKLCGLYSSITNTNAGMISPDTVIGRIKNADGSNGSVPVAMMYFEYNKFKQNN